jgi:carboxymethylenebutenolidase
MTNNSATDQQSATIDTPDGTMDVRIFHPTGPGAWPAVIINTDVRGSRPAFEAMAQRIAALGYVAVLPNLYYRVARPPVMDLSLPLSAEPSQERLKVLRAAVTVDGLHRDYTALLDYLGTQPCVRGPATGIVGYCMGGSIALRTAADFPQRIVAAASFHGGRLATDLSDSPHLRAAEIRAKLYMGYARDDVSMTDEMIVRLEQALRAAGTNFTSEHYDALHGYSVSDGQAFDAAAADKHWRALTALLEETLPTSA